MGDPVRRAVEHAYSREWALLVAVLARWTGDLDRAEEAAADAFAAAVESWVRDGVPDNPAAWLQTAARRRVLDRMRRDRTAREKAPALHVDEGIGEEVDVDDPFGRDPDATQDLLRLVFTCCHPSIAPTAQVGLALRLLCGLTTEEVARAFGVPEATVAQRVVRAKKKVHDASIAFRARRRRPPRPAAGCARRRRARLHGGTRATRGDDLVRADLCDSGVRLAALLHRLLPHQPEVLGLRGLLLVTDALWAARVDRAGRLVRLADSDRSRWRHADLDLGIELTTEALTRSGTESGAWTLQAAIAVANVAPQPDRAVIAALYDRLAPSTPRGRYSPTGPPRRRWPRARTPVLPPSARTPTAGTWCRPCARSCSPSSAVAGRPRTRSGRRSRQPATTSNGVISPTGWTSSA